jgi:hypothetical protein
MNKSTALNHQSSITDIHHETDDLLADNNCKLAHSADFFEGLRDILDNGGLDSFGWFVEDQKANGTMAGTAPALAKTASSDSQRKFSLG